MTRSGGVKAFADWAALLLVASLPLMKLAVPVANYGVTLTDGLFILAAGAGALAILRGEQRLRWTGFFVVLFVYFAGLALSLIVSPDLGTSALKLATQLYLVALPMLLFNLVDREAQLRRLMLAWLAGSTVPALIGTSTVVAFYAGVDRGLLDGPLHPYGTLVPGNYPRLETTFFYPAMLCNYLTVSLFVLFFAYRQRWLGTVWAAALFVSILVTVLFTLTPGLGGFLLALGLCIYWQAGRRRAGKLALAGGIAAALAAILVSTFTPVIHPTAPYLISLPGTHMTLAPAVRLLTWTAAAAVFAAHPLVGAGLGVAPIEVRYIVPSGDLHILNDAHNVYLNIAAQCGLAGLAGLLLLVGRVARDSLRFRGMDAALPLVLGLAWLDAFAVQGFVGSFEDARHLWVLLGLWLASIRLRSAGGYGMATTSGATRARRASTENNRSGV